MSFLEDGGIDGSPGRPATRDANVDACGMAEVMAPWSTKLVLFGGLVEREKAWSRTTAASSSAAAAAAEADGEVNRACSSAAKDVADPGRRTPEDCWSGSFPKWSRSSSNKFRDCSK